MGQPAARISDPCAHGGMVTMGSSNVLIGKKPAARKGDAHTCPIHGPGKIVKVSKTVLINGVGAARVSDSITCDTGPSPASGDSAKYDVKNGNQEVVHFDASLKGGALEMDLKAGPFSLDAGLKNGLLSGKISLPGGVSLDLSKGGVSLGANVGGVHLDAKLGKGGVKLDAKVGPGKVDATLGGKGGPKVKFQIGGVSGYVAPKGERHNAYAKHAASAFGGKVAATALRKFTGKKVGASKGKAGGAAGGKPQGGKQRGSLPKPFRAFDKSKPNTTKHAGQGAEEQAFSMAKKAFEMLGAIEGDFAAGKGLNLDVGMGKGGSGDGGGGGADSITQGIETVFVGG